MKAAFLAALLAATPPSAPAYPTEAYRAALDRLYDGSTDAAVSALDGLAAAHPDDPVGAYLAALALCWKVEQRPDTAALDADLEARLDRVVALASSQLRADPADDRARLALGGAHGVRSRLYIFRDRTHPSARAAASMREALLPLRGRGRYADDAAFGLGLYDYFVDVLPGIARLLRILAGLPGGDRVRGLTAIEAARAHAEVHQVEAAWQLYRIHALYDDEPDLALADMTALRERYPGAPFWALKLTEHERERTGRYRRAADVAGAVVAAAARGEANYGPGAAALGRLAQGEALLLDLRLEDAREVLAPFAGASADAPGAARGRLLLGRAFELDGQRSAALAHYRAAAAAADKELRSAADRALASPLPREEVQAAPHLAAARRHREAGRTADSVAEYGRALAAWPASAEARVRVAEEGLRRGAPSARPLVAQLAALDHPRPPWVRPWAWLLQGYVHDLDGRRGDAVQLYNKVLKTPHGDEGLAREARARLARPFSTERPAETHLAAAYH